MFEFFAGWPVEGDADNFDKWVVWSDGKNDRPIVVSRPGRGGTVVVIGDTHFASNENLESDRELCPTISVSGDGCSAAWCPGKRHGIPRRAAATSTLLRTIQATKRTTRRRMTTETQADNDSFGTDGMIRFWIGTALLAGSWLLGLDYFYPASPWAWLAAVVAAVVLLGKTDSVPRQTACGFAAAPAAASYLFLPAVWFAAWPYRAAPLLIVLGLGGSTAADPQTLVELAGQWGHPRRRHLARSSIGLGTICRPHHAVARLALAPARRARQHRALLGIDATADGSAIVMHSMRQVHRLAATWELLLDPATFLFFIGGLVMLALRRNDECGMMHDQRRADMRVVGRDESTHHSSFIIHHFSNWSAWIRGLDADRCRPRLAAAAGRPAYGPVSAPRAAIRSRPAAARDEPFLFAVAAVVVAGRTGAVGMAIRAKEMMRCGMMNDECSDDAVIVAEGTVRSSFIRSHPSCLRSRGPPF